MTDLVPHPSTGEALDLARPSDELVYWLDQLRDLESRSREARDVIGVELLRRMDAKASWTLRAGEFSVTAPSPAPRTEWDVDALRQVLSELQGEGMIDSDATDAALTVEVVYKPRVAGVNALRKLGGEVAARIEACGVSVPPTRRVSLKRSGRAA